MRILFLLGIALILEFALAVSGDFILDDQAGAQVTRIVNGGNPERGREAIIRYGCFACHVISGMGKASGRVGPKLLDIEQQVYLGGVVPNTPDGMIMWIGNPRKFSPETAMPDMGISAQEARDVAAYLYENE